jgi:hypothetical protein
MKCPKCGFNSFEYYDSCKKCSNDLTSYKATYGIKPIVLPAEVRASMAEELLAQTALNTPQSEASDAPVDMFSFDVPDAQPSSSLTDDPFNFDDEPATAHSEGGFEFDDNSKADQAKADEDAFADLLESTSQKDETAEATASKDSTELGNFSWDDVPADATSGNTKTVEDDFNSLFGETDDSTKK